MDDPRLNSMHLEMDRREGFRRARSELLHACGDRTQIEAQANLSKTAPQMPADQFPPGVNFALMDQQAVFPLRVGLNTVGRLADNDIVLPDPYVSRRHCAVVIHAGHGGELHDVASKNGTYLNGHRIDHPTPLQSGDEIRMSDRRLVFVAQSNLPSPSKSTQTEAELD